MSDDAPSTHPAPPAPGLHLLATPIGAARDITLRALDILAGADVLAAEDTRTLRRLMDIHAVAVRHRPVLAYHEHNAAAVRPRILAALAEGRSVAYASDAGTPLVADPGYGLARAAIADGHAVWAAPGPSAVLAALTVSGLPSDRFLFAGFPPVPAGARRRWAEELKAVPATLIVYESPRRIHGLLAVLCDVWGAERAAALCRELTKRFEEVRRGTLAELAHATAQQDTRGEVVLVVDRAAEAPPDAAQMEALLAARLEAVSLKLAVAEVAEATGLPRREVYQAALRLSGRG